MSKSWSYWDEKLELEKSLVCAYCGTEAPADVGGSIRLVRMIYREMGVQMWPNVPDVWCSDDCRRAMLRDPLRSREFIQAPVELGQELVTAGE